MNRLSRPRAARHFLPAIIICLVQCHVQAQTAALPFRNDQLPVSERINDLLGRLTLEEKISLLGYNSKAVPRLGIPAYNWWNEGLHGVARAGLATVFPQAIGLAATWDTDLVHGIADV